MKKINHRRAVKAFFNNFDGDPFELTGGQEKIFKAIYDPEIPRVAVKATTQYGKSDVTAMALILAVVTRREKVLIVAPSTNQARIIMNYVIGHLFDAQEITAMIEQQKGLEKLKKERSKRRITFVNGSEIFFLTANEREVMKEAKNLMGFGATIVVCDESSLLPDVMFTKILRMVLTERGLGGGHKKKLVQLGNPFKKNHFGKAFDDENYERITVGWEQAVEEGRMTKEAADEARANMSPIEFQILYESEFPDTGTEDVLIPHTWIDLAIENKDAVEGEKKAGLDVARFGKDSTVYCFRSGGVVKRIEEVTKRETMEVVGWVSTFLDKDKPDALMIDVVGLGSGVYDRLNELKKEVVPVNVGEKASGNEEGGEESKNVYFNLKAQIFWDLRSKFEPVNGKSTISIPNDTRLIEELKELRYTFDSRKRRRIEGKEQMKKRLGRSPDKADALALSFMAGDNKLEFYL